MHFRARRANNMVDQLPASSNFPHIIFLILNENLIPTYQYSSRIFVFKIAKTFKAMAILKLGGGSRGDLLLKCSLTYYVLFNLIPGSLIVVVVL